VLAQQISETAYQSLVANAQVLKLRRGNPAILLTPDQRIIKHIYQRPWYSSSRIWPYAQRFITSAKQLAKQGILVPEIHARYYYAPERCEILVYSYLNGKSLLTLALENNDTQLQGFPAFVAKLHRLGIFFRDLHLDNIIVYNNEYALIDLASVKCYRKSLSLPKRAKNLLKILSKKEDQSTYNRFGKDNFIQQYMESCGLSSQKMQSLKNLMAKYESKKTAVDSRLNAQLVQNT
jgi:tRNA A-37 threonylcarbamoyl transferase component Bud32